MVGPILKQEVVFTLVPPWTYTYGVSTEFRQCEHGHLDAGCFPYSWNIPVCYVTFIRKSQ